MYADEKVLQFITLKTCIKFDVNAKINSQKPGQEEKQFIYA